MLTAAQRNPSLGHVTNRTGSRSPLVNQEAGH